MEHYLETIIIRQDDCPQVDTPSFDDSQCDALFKFRGLLELKQIIKSVQNSTHNKHDYVFKVVSIDKFKEV